MCDGFYISSNSRSGKVGINTFNPYAPLSLRTAPSASNASNLADKGILLHAPGATDEQVIPISASFVTNAHLPRCAMGFISHPTADPIEGYAGEIAFYTHDAADGSAINPAHERVRITRSGTLYIGCTARPTPTVSGFTVENYGKDVRWSNGGGTSGTTAAGLSIFGGGNSTNVLATTSWGANIALHNTNNTNGNSSCLSFCASTQLATSFVIGETTSHSGRTGELVFATSNGAAPLERLRIKSDGIVQFYNSIYGADNKPIYLGNQNDLSIYHDSGGASIIRFNHAVGGLHFRDNNNVDQFKIQADGNMRWYPDGASGVNFYMSSNGAEHISFGCYKNGAIATAMSFKTQTSGGQAGTWLEVNGSQQVSIPYGMGGTDKLNIYVGADITKGINIMGQDGANQNSHSGRIHFNGYAQTNGPWIGGTNTVSYGKKALVFGTVSTTNDYTTEVGETLRLTEYGNVQFGISPDSTLWDSSNNEQGWYYRRAEGSMAMATRSSTGYCNFYMNKNTSGGTSDNRWLDFYWNSSSVDKIWYNSGNVGFGGYSDYRLKENIVEIDDGIATVKQLKPSYYTWKKGHGRDEYSDIKQDGFIAHEIQSVLPHLVMGTKDQVVTQAEFDAGTQPEESPVGTPIYQSIDYQRITPILTAAIKELIAEVETLKTEVAALKSS